MRGIIFSVVLAILVLTSPILSWVDSGGSADRLVYVYRFLSS
jgi:amino acid transporter